jgi:hypothetical protein
MGEDRRSVAKVGLARSERFELPTLGIEIRCSIQLSYERVRPADYQTWPGRASSGMSVTGIPPAVLADIGGRALAAEDGGGAIIKGEGAGLQAGAVIVQVADRVGQPPVVLVVPIMAGIGQTWGQGRGGEEGGGNEKLRFGHFDSPEVSLKQVRIRAERIALRVKKSRQINMIDAEPLIRSKPVFPDIVADLVSYSRSNG